MDLMNIARKAIEVAPDDSVMHAVDVSLPAKTGAVVVVAKGKMVGMFSERDLMGKVVHKRLDPDQTRVKDVMTTKVFTVPAETPVEEVLKLMLSKGIRHVPISADGQTVQGIVSIRNVLQFIVDDLKDNLRHMENFLGADGIGG